MSKKTKFIIFVIILSIIIIAVIILGYLLYIKNNKPKDNNTIENTETIINDSSTESYSENNNISSVEETTKETESESTQNNESTNSNETSSGNSHSRLTDEELAEVTGNQSPHLEEVDPKIEQVKEIINQIEKYNSNKVYQYSYSQFQTFEEIKLEDILGLSEEEITNNYILISAIYKAAGYDIEIVDNYEQFISYFTKIDRSKYYPMSTGTIIVFISDSMGLNDVGIIIDSHRHALFHMTVFNNEYGSEIIMTEDDFTDNLYSSVISDYYMYPIKEE